MATTELSDSEYAARRKSLLALTKKLNALGAQSELDVPRIVVIGNQSAGKSSVVERISGITVPRDAGTCTRCPFECRMVSAKKSEWTCRVSIRREFDSQGNRLTQTREDVFIDGITSKNAVELALRQAQYAVLNPNIMWQTILNFKPEQLTTNVKTLPFSRNIVCVDLKGPDLTDLSFIDLPGLIQNAEPEIVKLVEDMVISHIKGNCLILVALPMTDDIENQKALRLARQVDPVGKRTIGVLTKADLCTSGSTKAQANWLHILEGRQHILKHGYYCTRQLNDAERSQGVTPKDAEGIETTFFRATEPWSKSVHRERFGTAHLTAKLSRLLVQVISDTLPKLQSMTMERLEECRLGLSQLPKAIEQEPATHLFNLIHTLAQKVQEFVRGGPNCSTLIHEHRATYAVLKSAIRSTAPNYCPSTKPTNTDVYDDDSEDDDTFENNQPLSQFTLTDMRKHIQKSITRELPGNIPFESKVALITDFQGTWSDAVDLCVRSVKVSVEKHLRTVTDGLFLRYPSLHTHISDYVRELIDKHYTLLVPLLDTVLTAERTPFTQNTHYLQVTTEKWHTKYKEARSLSEPGTTASASAAGIGNAPKSAAKPTTPDTPTPQATSIPTTAFGPASKPSAFGSGFSSAFGPNSSPFVNLPSTPKETRPTPSIFSTAPPAAAGSKEVQEALAALAKVGFAGLTFDDLVKLKPPDEYEAEIVVMSEVRAYFQCSYKRIIDSIPMFIDLRFVKAISSELQSHLITKFGLGSDNANERCASMLVEDEVVVAQRDKLTWSQELLRKIQYELQQFGLPTAEH